jgi:hypothetical protein
MGWVKPVIPWWSKTKRWFLFLLGAISICAIIILVLMMFSPLILDNVFCTLADCLGDGVHINLVGGEIPSKYTVEVDFPSGKRRISCPGSSPDFSGHDACEENGVFFEQLDSQGPRDKPPKTLRVIVEFDGKQISNTFSPIYEFSYANGEGCSPMCYFTTIEFNLSE